jgi:hypothetical protein
MEPTQSDYSRYYTPEGRFKHWIIQKKIKWLGFENRREEHAFLKPLKEDVLMAECRLVV